MKNYKQIIAPLVAISFAFAPLIGFAETENNVHVNSNTVSKVKTHLSVSSRENSNRSIRNSQTKSTESKDRIIGAATTTPNTARPVISGMKAPTVLLTDQVGTWTLKAFDPQNGNLSYTVDWGDTPSGGLLRAPLAPVFVQTSTFTHSYIIPGTYKITFTVTNDAGNKTTTTTTVHVNQAPETLPVISNVVATSTSIATSTISWTTDVKSSSLLWYGTTTPVSTGLTPNIIDNSNASTSHSIELNNLQASTTYYFVVGSSNSAGTATSTEMSFVTPQIPANPNAPVITGISGSPTVVVGNTETVTINAFDPQNGDLSYSVDWGDTPPIGFARLAAPVVPVVQTSTFDHIYDTAGTYTATFTVSNDAGFTATSTLEIIVTEPEGGGDVTAPIISDVGSVAGMSTSTVSWTTDEPATSQVFYSTSTPVDVTTALSVSDSALTTDHSLDISDLEASTTYNYVVVSADGSGNVSTSKETTFTTIPAPIVDVTGPIISDVVSVAGMSTSTVSWTTDEPAISVVFYSTSTPVNTTTAQLVSDATLITDHSLNISDLEASTTYNFVVLSADGSGNVSTSSEMTFTTSSAPIVDVTPPIITNVISTPGESTSTIAWNTDEPTLSKVFYSTTSPVDITTAPFISDGTLSTSHTLVIPGLADHTLYNFIVESTDASGNVATSSEATFTTSGPVEGAKTFTLADIAAHNTQASCWTAISGSVYDLTPFLTSHPGGLNSILSICGIDGTVAFGVFHAGQPNVAAELLTLKIGTLM